MENPSFEDVFPIGEVGFRLPGEFTGGYPILRGPML